VTRADPSRWIWGFSATGFKNFGALLPLRPEIVTVGLTAA
jgi:hypothetical protein